jgi:hypothetical protein
MTTNPDPQELHPDILEKDILTDVAPQEIAEFITRALEANDEVESLEESQLIEAITDVLGRQQLFGILTKCAGEGTNPEPHTFNTQTPTPLEGLLLRKIMLQSLKQLILLLDMHKKCPNGTIKTGFGGHTLQAFKDKKDFTSPIEELEMNVVQSLVMKAAIGDYLLNIHNLMTDDNQKEALETSLQEMAGIDNTQADQIDSTIGPALRKITEMGAPSFFKSPSALKKAINMHIDGKQDILDTMLATSIEDLPDIDRDILAHQIRKELEPVLEFLNEETD